MGYKEKYRDPEYMKKYRIKTNKHYNKLAIIRESKTLATWIGFIPEITQCQCCGKDIFFCSGNKMKSIHFDHRHGSVDDLNKRSPNSWLRNHKRTPENEVIWKKQDFGMICHSCNISLPTENRVRFLRNAVRYVGGI